MASHTGVNFVPDMAPEPFFCCFFIFKSAPAHTSYKMAGILTLFHSLRQNIGSAIKVMQAKNLKTIIEDEVDEDE